MARHFHEELKDLKQSLLKMGLMVEEAIENAIDAFLNQDSEIARRVIKGDAVINHQEIEIDDNGHALLALGQPMAVDLRMITGILKINSDLERMGDHAVNIAQHTLYLLESEPLKEEGVMVSMAEAVKKMLKDTLEAFINADVELARAVLKQDDEVDSLNSDLYFKLLKVMEGESKLVKPGINLISLGHDLERIADLCNNIAEDIVYMKLGTEIRHPADTQTK